MLIGNIIVGGDVYRCLADIDLNIIIIHHLKLHVYDNIIRMCFAEKRHLNAVFYTIDVPTTTQILFHNLGVTSSVFCEYLILEYDYSVVSDCVSFED